MSRSNLNRILLYVLFISAWGGLIAQIAALLSKNLDFGFTAVNFISYFTVQSNIFVALLASYWVFSKNESKSKYLKLFEFGTLVNITVTGIIYNVILAGIWQPQGLDLVADTLLHTVTPILFVVYWYLGRSKWRWEYQLAFVWLLYPVLYFVYSILRGSMVDWYPYPFVDASVLSTGQLVMNVVAMGVFIIVVGYIFIFINKRFKK